MHRFASLCMIILGCFVLGACSTSDPGLPTLAVLATADTGTASPTSTSIPATSIPATSIEPTPTREGESGPAAPDSTAENPGAGVGSSENELTLNGEQFVASLEGPAINLLIRGDATLSCNSGVVNLALDDGSSRILFALPDGAITGIYTLRNSGAENGIQPQIILGPGGVYDANPDGVLTLSRQGETFSGTFEISISNADQSITSRGLFSTPVPAPINNC